MKSRVLDYLNGLVTDNTTKAELDIIEYAKRAVRDYVEKEPKKKSGGFIPPTKDEVLAYVREKGYAVNVDKFYEYYTVAGWHDKNGKPVKNWKLKLLVWNHPNEFYSLGQKPKEQFIENNYSQETINGLIADLDKVEV